MRMGREGGEGGKKKGEGGRRVEKKMMMGEGRE
jgi:hypothetical protein